MQIYKAGILHPVRSSDAEQGAPEVARSDRAEEASKSSDFAEPQNANGLQIDLSNINATEVPCSAGGDAPTRRWLCFCVRKAQQPILHYDLHQILLDKETMSDDRLIELMHGQYDCKWKTFLRVLWHDVTEVKLIRVSKTVF